MSTTRGGYVLTICLLLSHLACDSRPPAPPDAAPVETEAERAPTVEPKRVMLDMLPFTVEVTTQWKVSRYGANPLTAKAMLEGPLPKGESHILLGLRESVSGDLMKLLIERALKDAPAIQKQGGDVRVRRIGEVQVIERRVMPGAATTGPTTLAADDATVDWRINLYVPTGLKYEQYELKVLGLDVTSLEENQPLIQAIFESLQFDDAPLPPM